MLLANVCAIVVLVVAPGPAAEAQESCFHPATHYGLRTGEVIDGAETWVDYTGALFEDAKAKNVSTTEGPMGDLDERRERVIKLTDELKERYKVDVRRQLERQGRQGGGFFSALFALFRSTPKVVIPIVAKLPKSPIPRWNSAPNIGAAVYPSLGELARTTSLGSLRATSVAAPLRFAGDNFVRPIAREAFKRRVFDYIKNNKLKVAASAVGGGAGVVGTAVTVWQIISNNQLASDIAASNKPVIDLAVHNKETIGEINTVLDELFEKLNDDNELDKLGFGMLGLVVKGDAHIAKLTETLGLLIDSSSGYIPPSHTYIEFFNEILNKMPPDHNYKPHTEGTPASYIDYLDVIRVFNKNQCIKARERRDADSQGQVYEPHSPYYRYHFDRRYNQSHDTQNSSSSPSAPSLTLADLPNYFESRVPRPYKPIEVGKKPMNFTPISIEPYERFQEDIKNHAPSIGISVAASIACGLFVFVVCMFVRKAIKERWGRRGNSGSANFSSPGTAVVAIVPPPAAAQQVAALDSVTLGKLEHLLQGSTFLQAAPRRSQSVASELLRGQAEAPPSYQSQMH